ncbi:3-hydroxyacyl-ACP dehydratase FabZ [Secundilactobacillus collinoides]|uniref:(3R)-hydroxymyristoyl-ACP dehydratase n=2 Tax=Secundilactobacillus collinoides TaxID=33960 RepID=A0A0R2BCK7_SECCO|nr:3-hydroxyacyl-ACP dehydratase FabZ [Secundilactobacillus collinoides]KRM77391.1 (3R)-hydroxymyristoyl-ACP dehydratase [Secundilactobacillus collinoides DSM 20515 = JCM 1123]KZL40502.1 3-hydroxyacyl-ACP dehydratase [Secundilactobacillus collinoides]
MQLTSQEIQTLIPNRFPIFYMDGVTELTPGESITAIKNVTADESFVNGYRPGEYIMPSALIVESLAQAASILILKSPAFQHKTAYLGGIRKAEFLKDVKASNQIALKVTMKKQRDNMGIVSCEAVVADEVCVRAELMFIVAPDGSQD